MLREFRSFSTAVAFRGYTILVKENPLGDVLYERRLRRIDLVELDRAWSASRRRSDVVVSLTTIPSRIGLLAPTLRSLLHQTVRPAAIRLNIPHASVRERAAYEIPGWLERLRAITIARCDDYGPATKIIPSLLDSSPDQRLLIVDDDRIYHRRLIEQLAGHSDSQPDIAVASSGWVVPPDLTDRPTPLFANIMNAPPATIRTARIRKATDVDIMHGSAGYLVKPRFFDVAALLDYSHAPAAAFFVDDVWISGHCRARKVVFPGRRTAFQSPHGRPVHARTSLTLINRGDEETKNSTIVIRHLADRWQAARQPGGVR